MTTIRVDVQIPLARLRTPRQAMFVQCVESTLDSRSMLKDVLSTCRAQHVFV